MVKKAQKPKKIPMRTCVGCGEIKPKRELLRIVRTPAGEVVVDMSGKANGRGTYVCCSRECAEITVQKGKIAHALGLSLGSDEQDRIKRDIFHTIEEVRSVG